MKINKTTLLLLLLFLQIQVFSQFADLPIQNQKDYNVLNKKIQRKYKCSQWFSKKDTSLKLIAVFKLHAIASISKEEFIDGSFLKKLEYSYIPEYKHKFKDRDFRLPQKPIPVGNFRVSSKEKTVAVFSYEYMKFMEFKKIDKEYYEKFFKKSFYENKPYEEYCEIRKSNTITSNSKAKFDALLNYIWDKGNLFIFQLEKTRYDTYFIINEQLDIFVFFKDPNGYYTVLTIKEFVGKYWERFSQEEGRLG